MRSIILAIGLLLSFGSHTASISAYRVYLDPENRTNKFMVTNNSNHIEKCEIKFSYVKYDEYANALALTDIEKTALSQPALSRIRYSPKNFSIDPREVQYITFAMKRRINEEPNEYRTYFNLRCVNDSHSEQSPNNRFTIKPVLVHSVPLIVRTGKLNAKLSFDNVTRANSSVSFQLTRTGERSVFGDIKLYTASGEEISTLSRSVVLYPEMKYKEFNFSLSGYEDKKLKLVFEEKLKYGGSLTVEQNI